MILYHGTTSDVARNVLAGEGILPTALSRKQSNWAIDGNHSNSRCVYLTSCYGVLYSLVAKGIQNELNGDIATDNHASIIEINGSMLNRKQLFHDEDFLEEHYRVNKKYTQDEVSKRLKLYCRNMFKYDKEQDWKDSLDIRGTVAYKSTVPVEAIIRVAHIDFNNISDELSEAIYEKYTKVQLCRETHPNYGEVNKELTLWVLGKRGPHDARPIWKDRSAIVIEENPKYAGAFK